MGRRSPISRAEALALCAFARESHPLGDTISFRLSGAQARAARGALGLSVDAVAEMAGLAPLTVENVEAGINADRADLGKVRGALEKCGAAFVARGDLQAVVLPA